MKKYIINNFYICGNYIAGDYIDIHDNPSATVYHRYPVPAPDAVEDVAPEGERATCPFLVVEKLSELGLYTQEQFEVLFREAAEKDAKTFSLFLKKYRQLGVLNFRGYDKKQIFAILQASFPSMRQYTYRNFVEYF